MEAIVAREMRKELGLSQVEVSLRTGISRFRLSQFECGYAPLTKAEFQTLSNFLDRVQLLSELSSDEKVPQ